MKKMMRLMKNRLSARKCRQKKKHYVNYLEEKIKNLEEKLLKHQSRENKEKQVESLINIVN